MKQYKIYIADEARADLRDIRNYFSERFSEAAADVFVQEILADCQNLSMAPFRGSRKAGAPVGFRQIGAASNRVTLLFHVDDDSVAILAVHYRGRQR